MNIIRGKMKKEHIDDVQAPTVDEHFKLLLEDETVLDPKMKDVTFDDLPEWYNEKLCKEGQNFYKRNVMAIEMANIVGVLSVLSFPQILKVITYTNKSSSPCSAFRRYAQTILHDHNLQTCDPSNPDSNWYKSLNVIRWKHNSTNSRAENDGVRGIYYKDMAFTQFAFLGYIIVMAKSVGIRSTPEEEEAFIHLWRVIGYMIGIPDRLNICRKNAAETRELSTKIVDVIVHHLTETPPSFYRIASNILDGLWNVNMILNKDAILAFIYRVYGIEYKKPLDWYSRLIMKYYISIFYLCLVPYVGAVVRIYNNYIFLFSLWLTQRMPLTAWITYGKKHSQLILYPKNK